MLDGGPLNLSFQGLDGRGRSFDEKDTSIIGFKSWRTHLSSGSTDTHLALRTDWLSTRGSPLKPDWKRVGYKQNLFQSIQNSQVFNATANCQQTTTSSASIPSYMTRIESYILA